VTGAVLGRPSLPSQLWQAYSIRTTCSSKEELTAEVMVVRQLMEVREPTELREPMELRELMVDNLDMGCEQAPFQLSREAITVLAAIATP
jgi:hypothetical protein